jgi:Type II/IV secretion system protein
VASVWGHVSGEEPLNHWNLQLEKPDLVPFEARQAQPELPAITIRDLLKASLRHRPDRIILGEIRGGEAFDLLQLLNTGHSGNAFFQQKRLETDLDAICRPRFGYGQKFSSSSSSSSSRTGAIGFRFGAPFRYSTGMACYQSHVMRA